jgi:signal transduction histidine kinase
MNRPIDNRRGRAGREAAQVHATSLQAEEALREGRRFVQSTLDALSAQIAILDADGRVIIVNAAWRRFAEENGYCGAGYGVGSNYLEVCEVASGAGAEEALAVARGIREIVAYARDTFSVEYACHSPTAQRWFAMRATRFPAAGPACVMVAHEDITERKQDEARLHALSRRLVDVQEAERRRLARELHDQVGQNLTALSINLSIMRGLLSGEALVRLNPRLEDSQLLVEETIDRIRDLTAALRPAVLDDYGLDSALRWYAEQFSERTGISAYLRGAPLVSRLPSVVETVLFRIAQEALTNVAKHAQANYVMITLETHGSAARLALADDGVGFCPAEMSLPEPARGLGLISMRERAESVGGRLSIKSAPGMGTRVVVTVAR